MVVLVSNMPNIFLHKGDSIIQAAVI